MIADNFSNTGKEINIQVNKTRTTKRSTNKREPLYVTFSQQQKSNTGTKMFLSRKSFHSQTTHMHDVLLHSVKIKRKMHFYKNNISVIR